MRVTTDFFVSALVRRVFGEGGFAAVVERGAAEAGAVFVTVRGRTGLVSLYGPAAQASYETGRPDDRAFGKLADDLSEEDLGKRIAREKRFDPDLWVVEVEPSRTPVEELLTLTTP